MALLQTPCGDIAECIVAVVAKSNDAQNETSRHGAVKISRACRRKQRKLRISWFKEYALPKRMHQARTSAKQRPVVYMWNSLYGFAAAPAHFILKNVGSPVSGISKRAADDSQPVQRQNPQESTRLQHV